MASREQLLSCWENSWNRRILSGQLDLGLLHEMITKLSFLHPLHENGIKPPSKVPIGSEIEPEGTHIAYIDIFDANGKDVLGIRHDPQTDVYEALQINTETGIEETVRLSSKQLLIITQTLFKGYNPIIHNL